MRFDGIQDMGSPLTYPFRYPKTNIAIVPKAFAQKPVRRLCLCADGVDATIAGATCTGDPSAAMDGSFPSRLPTFKIACTVSDGSFVALAAMEQGLRNAWPSAPPSLKSRQ